MSAAFLKCRHTCANMSWSVRQIIHRTTVGSMDQIWGLLVRMAGVVMIVSGVLFAVYFWSLDKKTIVCVKRILHRLFAREPVSADPSVDGYL